MIRAVVVDDDTLIRSGIVAILSGQPDIEVIGQAPDGLAGVAMVTALAPDVVVMDIRMPGMTGVEATRTICAGGVAPPVLILTTFDGDPDVLDALRAGASGYLLKRSPADLPEAVRRVVAGDVWLDPGIAGQILAALSATPRAGTPSAQVAMLTAREREVLALLAEGLSNAEIAQRLFVGPGTVKTHMSRILFKTGCRDRAAATALAFTSGLVIVGTMGS
ncbi:MAG: response regulator transcription factor [Micropruina sp.]